LTAFEEKGIIPLFKNWLGAKFYNSKDDALYVRVFNSVIESSIGVIPSDMPIRTHMYYLETFWSIFKTVIDGVARQWLQTHRTSTFWPQVAVLSGNDTAKLNTIPAGQFKDKVALNSASTHELEKLPGIGPKTAPRIVVQREQLGGFTSFDDLIGINGVTAQNREQIMLYCTLDDLSLVDGLTSSELMERNEPIDFLTYVHLVAKSGLSAGGSTHATKALSSIESNRLAVRNELRKARMWVVRKPFQFKQPFDISRLRRYHKARKNQKALEQNARTDSTFGAAIIRNSIYLTTAIDLINSAQSSIFVQMFFFTSPEGNMPGQRLLAALRDAVTRGVDVRLILDNDIESDYHQASIINDESKEELRQRSIPFRTDSVGTTTHSKIMLVDDAQLLIGTHNWTTNAMYRIDETSVYVENEYQVAKEKNRFETLWDAYDPNPETRSIHFNLLRYLTREEKNKLSNLGYTNSRAFLDDNQYYQSVKSTARRAEVDETRLLQFWRLLKLMHAFGFSEPTAFAFTLTVVNSPSEFDDTSLERILELLHALPSLPNPFLGQPIRYDVVKVAHG